MLPDLYQERQYTVRGVTIACKIWQPDAPYKLIALHGWLDNAASFDALAPLLQDCCVLVPDLPGQGLSDNRPAAATYHLWDDVQDVILLTDHLQWQTFSMIGHSRGAMLSVMLAAAFPERVHSLKLLDALMPLPVGAQDAPWQLRKHVEDSIRAARYKFFAERSDAVAFRARAAGIEYALAEQLAQRQLRETEQGWSWHSDERLKAASAFKMTAEHNDAFLSALSCPVDVFLATRGIGAYQGIASVRNRYQQFNWYDIDGHHHCHMTTEVAAEIASLCTKW